ncbi:unnamed protein product [Clonostachys rosea f. rosea IK726]|jgi:glutathione S-transferase|uniref:Uncharacterized protein n=1 Tax=Clonostachys rosea f. rosea IK726 TaxID=1349383 RepID=A0ACA9UIR9_BIOOC|nr:unnamed protein product [Clonostachys rosea f. rosea IK726]
MTLIVHHLQVSQSERIPWLCEELGIDYELKNYKRAPIFAPPEYKALHPQGTAPIIQDGDLFLAESGACIEYIYNKHGPSNPSGPKLFLEPSDPAYAEFLYWWHWSNTNFQASISRSMLVQSAGLGDDNPTVKYGRERFATSLKILEDRLKGNKWLVGEKFTVADIMIVFSLTTMRNWHPYSLRDYANILSYLQRVSERETYRRAMKKSDPDMELILGAESPSKPFLM